MQPIKLLHLLRHLSQEAGCPQCKASINPESISVFSSTESSAFLSIFCSECGQHLFAQAFLHLSPKDIPEESPNNNREITAEDLQNAGEFLSAYSGDIGSLFS